jgi:hypothetical protein
MICQKKRKQIWDWWWMIFFLVVCFIIYVLDLNFYLSLSCLFFFRKMFVLSFDFRNSSRFFFMYKHSNPCNPNQNTRYRQTRNPLKPCIKMGRSGPVYFTRGLGWTDLLGLNQPNPTRCPPLEVAYTQTFIW